MNDRLLTQKEFEKADSESKWEGDCEPIIRAQDAKTVRIIIKEIDLLWKNLKSKYGIE